MGIATTPLLCLLMLGGCAPAAQPVPPQRPTPPYTPAYSYDPPVTARTAIPASTADHSSRSLLDSPSSNESIPSSTSREQPDAGPSPTTQPSVENTTTTPPLVQAPVASESTPNPLMVVHVLMSGTARKADGVNVRVEPGTEFDFSRWTDSATPIGLLRNGTFPAGVEITFPKGLSVVRCKIPGLPAKAATDGFPGVLKRVAEPLRNTCGAHYVLVERDVNGLLLDGTRRSIRFARGTGLNFAAMESPGKLIANTRNPKLSPHPVYFTLPSSAVSFWVVPNDSRSTAHSTVQDHKPVGASREKAIPPPPDKPQPRREPEKTVDQKDHSQDSPTTGPDAPRPPVPVYVPCSTIVHAESGSRSRTVVFSKGDAAALFRKYVADARSKGIDLDLESLTVVLFIKNGDVLDQIAIPAPRLTTVQRMRQKHEEKWLEQLVGKIAYKLPEPAKTAEQWPTPADVVCGD